MTGPHRVVVALTGAQGTGKSTLGRQVESGLNEAGWSCALLTNLGAEVGGAVLATMSPRERVLRFLDAHQRRDRRIVAPMTIIDRCMLDALAYASLLGCLTANEWSRAVEATRQSLASVDDVFLLPVRGGYDVRSVLDEDIDTRARISELIEELAAELDQSLIRLPDHSATATRTVIARVLELASARGHDAVPPR